MSWARRALRRCKVPLPFSGVICAEHSKTIRVDAGWRAQVSVQQTLVFLDVPEAGDLYDTCQVDAETTLDDFGLQSADSIEVGRRRRGRGAIVIDWKPRGRVVPFALYEHHYSWFPAGSHAQPALCSEFLCEAKTGSFVLQVITPETFEAAVVFERPRWPLLNTERSLIKYALRQLEAEAVGEPATILDNGKRIEWKILGPKRGVRYVCVAFHRNGIALWRDTLKKASLFGRMRQLVGLAST
jgi:hypothetical protein